MKKNQLKIVKIFTVLKASLLSIKFIKKQSLNQVHYLNDFQEKSDLKAREGLEDKLFNKSS
jgi:hypothetical protein